MLTRKQYIDAYSLAAAKAVQGTTIQPQTVFAQAILESQDKGPDGNYYPGYSIIARAANNHFNIKADESWAGPVYSTTIYEGSGSNTVVYNGTDRSYVSRNAALQAGANYQTLFRAYASVEDSYADYVKFIKTNGYYSPALQTTDWRSQINIIAAKYATGAGYAQLLQDVAESVLSTIESDFEAAKKKLAEQTSPLPPLQPLLGGLSAPGSSTPQPPALAAVEKDTPETPETPADSGNGFTRFINLFKS